MNQLFTLRTLFHDLRHFALLLSAALCSLSALAQSPPAGLPKPATSAEVRLTEFVIPPFPVALVGMQVKGGSLQLLTQMPISGRPLPTSETPKPRGAEFPSSAAYLCRQTLNAQGQPTTPAQGLVFTPTPPSAQPADFAVFGTRAADGPLRLPLGGPPDQLATQFPDAAAAMLPRQRVSLLSTGPGLNYASYKLSPRYLTVGRALEFNPNAPASGRLLLRGEETAPQRTATEAKLPAYVAVNGSNPDGAGSVIAFSPTLFEGVATRYVESDKNASARNASLLTFDESGNLLANLPLTFAFNRTLTARLPVHDATGKVVGSLSVFGNGPGKKDVLDPEENRVEVVITDETGKLWSQFQWVAGGSSSRAVIPIYARRQNDQVLLYSTNQQKIFKPTQESWSFDKAGKATLLGSMPYTGIYDLSKQQGVVNGGETVGWYNFTTGYYVDSFAGANGATWVLMQRQKPAFGLPGVASGTPPAGFNDLFVLRFDDKMQLQSQTVVALRPLDSGPLALTRSLRADGADVIVGDANSLWLKIRGNTLTAEYPTQPDKNQPTPLGRSHAAFDDAGKTLYLLTELPQKPGTARLNTYSLD